MTETRRMMRTPFRDELHEYDARCCNREGLVPCTPIEPEAGPTEPVTGRRDTGPNATFRPHASTEAAASASDLDAVMSEVEIGVEAYCHECRSPKPVEAQARVNEPRLEQAIRAYAEQAYQRGFEDGKMGASNNAGA